ncbi:MAG: hypothetical protein NVSMB16_06620 [Acidimicrobiales bacterium]
MGGRAVGRVIAAAVGLVMVSQAAPAAIWRAEAAPQRRWPVGSRSLRIEDRTGDARWRIAAIHAVDGWNAQGAGIRLTYTSTPSFSGGCGDHGTTVSLCRNHLSGGTLAVTTYRATSSGTMKSAFVEVNADRSPSDDEQQSILCHELGHVLGMDHSPDSLTSCLGTDANTFPLSPDDRDARILRSMYVPR